MRTICGTVLAACGLSLQAAEPAATAFVAVDPAKEIGPVKGGETVKIPEI